MNFNNRKRKIQRLYEITDENKNKSEIIYKSYIRLSSSSFTKKPIEINIILDSNPVYEQYPPEEGEGI